MDDEHRERIRAGAAGGRRNLTEAERERRRIRTRRYMVKAHLARMPDDERIRLLAELLELYGFQAQLPG